MILETYLKNNNKNLHQMHLITKIPETTIRNINRRNIDKWNIEYFEAVSKTVGKNRVKVIEELEELTQINLKRVTPFSLNGQYNLENRRYIGNKNKLLSWISELIEEHTVGDSFFDVFAGTGVVTKKLLPKYNRIILNDFLFSNNIIFKAFFGTQDYNIHKILTCKDQFQSINTNTIDDDYFVDNYGEKFFSKHDARVIGEIRTRIHDDSSLNEREKAILIASLIYSADKIANTVGHYDAYRKKVDIKDRFVFNLINPLDIEEKK